jgi:hypothetical protein
MAFAYLGKYLYGKNKCGNNGNSDSGRLYACIVSALVKHLPWVGVASCAVDEVPYPEEECEPQYCSDNFHVLVLLV